MDKQVYEVNLINNYSGKGEDYIHVLAEDETQARHIGYIKFAQMLGGFDKDEYSLEACQLPIDIYELKQKGRKDIIRHQLNISGTVQREWVERTRLSVRLQDSQDM